MLNVTPDVLSPRPDTEAILDVVMLAYPPHQAFEMIDLGTGSGIIAITVAHERPDWLCTAVDVSSKALAIATSATSCRSALTSGCRVVVVPDEFTSFQDFGGARIIAEKLEDLNLDDALELVCS